MFCFIVNIFAYKKEDIMKTERYEQLDGLRAFAVCLVVASHTNAFKMTGQGGLAVAFFFVLSGYLLVLPWMKDGEERFCSLSGILSFYWRRILRLIPVYYVVYIAAHWLTDSTESLVDHLLFINCSGHLWFLQQEVLFYVLAPLFMLILALLKKKGKFPNLLIAALLFVGAHYAQKYLKANVFYLMGNGKKQYFRLGIFLMGMAFGYVQKSMSFSSIKNIVGKITADIVGIILLAASVFSSAYFLAKFNPNLSQYYVGWTKPLWCAFGSGILLLLITWNKDGYLSRFFRLPFLVYIGKMSYVIYLVHFFMLPYAGFSSPKKMFCAIFAASLGLAAVWNEWFEKPLQKLASCWPKQKEK